MRGHTRHRPVLEIGLRGGWRRRATGYGWIDIGFVVGGAAVGAWVGGVAVMPIAVGALLGGAADLLRRRFT
jgi:hypothetical protein